LGRSVRISTIVSRHKTSSEAILSVISRIQYGDFDVSWQQIDQTHDLSLVSYTKFICNHGSGIKPLNNQISDATETDLRLETGFFLLILTGGVGLRLFGLADLPLAQDALYTMVASVNFELEGNVRPVYFFISSIYTGIFGYGELSLRTPAFLFGVLGLIAIYTLTRTLFGWVIACMALTLVSLSPWHLYVSQFARYWSLIFLLSTLLAWLIFRFPKSPMYLVLAAVVAALGTLTHPLFAFLLPGIAVWFAFRAKDLLRLIVHRWWVVPTVVIVLGALTAFLLLGTSLPSLFSGELLFDEVVRFSGGMIQWVGPAVWMAFFFSVLVLLTSSEEHVRDWTWLSVAVVVSQLVFLFLATFANHTVYTDYFMPALPFIYVTVAIGFRELVSKLQFTSPLNHVALFAVLIASFLPTTVSHLIDGTRFDYRPSLNYLLEKEVREPVVGSPLLMQRYYAPSLNSVGFQKTINQLDQQIAVGSFYFIASEREYGLVDDPERNLRPWLSMNCREVLRTHEMRIDMRSYTVLLYRCEGGE